jgi:hypothetical protein
MSYCSMLGGQRLFVRMMKMMDSPLDYDLYVIFMQLNILFTDMSKLTHDVSERTLSVIYTVLAIKKSPCNYGCNFWACFCSLYPSSVILCSVSQGLLVLALLLWWLNCLQFAISYKHDLNKNVYNIIFCLQ